MADAFAVHALSPRLSPLGEGTPVTAERPTMNAEALLLVTQHDLDVAWAAGLFEGEGCWFWHRRADSKARGRGSLTGKAQLSMTDEDVVRRFAAVVGFGNIVFMPIRGNMQKPQWRWTAQAARDVRSLSAMFAPYAGNRRAAKAAEVLAAMATITIPWNQRTHCKNGHPLTGENLRLRTNTKGVTTRSCKTCLRRYGREAMRKWRSENVELNREQQREWRARARARKLAA